MNGDWLYGLWSHATGRSPVCFSWGLSVNTLCEWYSVNGAHWVNSKVDLTLSTFRCNSSGQFSIPTHQRRATSMYPNKRLTWKFNVWNSKFECISIPICSIRIFSIRMFSKVRNSLEFKNCIPYSLNRKVRYGMLSQHCCVLGCSMQKVMTRCWNQSARNNLVWPN